MQGRGSRKRAGLHTHTHTLRQVYLVPTEPILRKTTSMYRKYSYTIEAIMIISTMFGYMYGTCTLFVSTCSDQVKINPPHTHSHTGDSRSIYLSISIYLYLSLSLYFSLSLYIHIYIYIFIYLSIYLSIYLLSREAHRARSSRAAWPTSSTSARSRGPPHAVNFAMTCKRIHIVYAILLGWTIIIHVINKLLYRFLNKVRPRRGAGARLS